MNDFQRVTVAGSLALAELDRHRRAFPMSGLWPILFGEASSLDRIFHVTSMRDPADKTPDIKRQWIEVKKEYNPDGVPAILAESRKIDVAQWFRDRAADEDKGEVDSDVWGEWPKFPGDPMEIVTHRNVLSREVFDEVVIGLFPVAHPWEVFAHLDYGHWPGCPAAAYHCAIHRYWAERHSAEVVSITGDVVQCLVSRPPTDREGSLLLALEQYLYCGDIVDQGLGTITELAAILQNDGCWYFWWD